MKSKVQKGVGLLFLFAGIGKLILPLVVSHLPAGTPTFGDVLAAAGTPAPHVMAVFVCLVEIVFGLALFLDRYVKTACAVLLGDMIGALVTLSIPATFFAQPVKFGKLSLGNEPWRVPLEVVLAVLLIWIGQLWNKSAWMDALRLRK